MKRLSHCFACLLLLWAAPLLAAKPKQKPAVATPPPPVEAPAPVALPLPATPEAPPAPGALILITDADTDEATVAGQVVSLHKGENRVALPAGAVVFAVRFGNGLLVKGEAVVPPGGEARAEAWSAGRIAVHVGDGAKVEIDGKPATVAAGEVVADAGVGSHTVLVTQPGHIGKRASVDVIGGHTTEITPNLAKFEVDVDNTLPWIAVLGGGALIVSALVIDAVTRYDKVGGEATRWGLLGLGTAGFVGGTLLLKANMDAVGTPPTQDGAFDVRITRRAAGAMAVLGWRF